jgi:uncharacterized membrane protein
LKSANRIWLWLIPVLLLVAALGVRGLNMDMLWLDEVFSIGNTGGYEGPAYNPVQVWESLSSNSPQHVPGYFFVLAGWAALTGWTAFGLRVLSLLIGMLAVAWTYRLGADWLNPRAGLYAASVLGIGAFYLYFTHEVRMYTLIAFLTVFTLWAYWRIIRKDLPHPPARGQQSCLQSVPPTPLAPSPSNGEGRLNAVQRGEVSLWLAFFLGALGLLYTHLFGALVLAAIGLYHLLFVRKNRRWIIVSAILAVVGASILPWLNVLLTGVRNVGLGEEPLAPQLIFTEMLHLSSSGNVIELLLLAALALLGLGLRRRGAREVWFFLIVIFALTIIGNQARPMISEGRTRYLIHLWPLLALLVGLGLSTLEALRWRVLVLPLLGVWLVVGLVNTLDDQFLIDMDGPRYVKDYPPLREIVADVNTLAQPEDLLISFSRQGHVFEIFRFFTVGDFYTQNLVPTGYFRTLPDVRPEVELRGDLLNTIGERLTVWFAYEPVTPAADLAPFRAVLDEAYTLCDAPVQQPGYVIERYSLSLIGCVDLAKTDAQILHYDAGIDLQAMRAIYDTAQNRVLMAGAWSVDAAVPANTYSVSFKLWPADDAKFLAQADVPLRASGFGWQLVSLPVENLPPGDYGVTATVYNWSIGERLIASGASGEQGDEMPVANVTIEAAD